MKSNKITFLLSEIILGLLLLLCVFLIFSDEKPQKRVAVIIEKSGDEKWDSFINGIKQAAREKNIHLIICNTDEIEDAQEEKSLITEQMDNQVDAFIIQAAPGTDTAAMLSETSTQKPVILVSNNIQSQYSDLPLPDRMITLWDIRLGKTWQPVTHVTAGGRRSGLLADIKIHAVPVSVQEVYWMHCQIQIMRYSLP